VRRCAQQVGQLGIEVLLVHRVAELVEQRSHPVFVRAEIAEDPDVRAPVDRQAERVLILPRPLEEIGAPQQLTNVEVDRPEVGLGQRVETLSFVVAIEVDRDTVALEEGNLVVPRPQLRDPDPERTRPLGIQLALARSERPSRAALELVEETE
jgi:hypothetical protein